MYGDTEWCGKLNDYLKNKRVKILVAISMFLLVAFFFMGYKYVVGIKRSELEREIFIKEQRLKEEKIKEEKIKEEKIEEEKHKEENLLRIRGTEEALEADLSIGERIELYLDEDLKNFGFIYYDLTTDEKIEFNGEKIFTAASTYKVGLNMLVYDDVINGRLEIDDCVMYNHAMDFEEGGGRLQFEIDTTLTRPVSLQKLLDLSIIESDNIASNMLIRTLGGFRVVRERTDAIAGLSVDTTQNKTTSEIQFRILKNLYENKDNMYYAYLLDRMKETFFHNSLDKYLPYEIVAHKIGNYESSVHDIGIVFTDKPYILVAYSEDIYQSEEKIAKISEMIYKEQLKKLLS